MGGEGKTSDGEEISAIVTKLADRKVVDVKTCHSPTTFTGYGLTLMFVSLVFETICMTKKVLMLSETITVQLFVLYCE